jgi:CspA family cold shock protein
MVREGTVNWFSKEKGYGFISALEEGKNLFVHYSEIEGSGYKSLEEGERVLYEVPARGTRGPRAIEVRRIE